MLDIKLIRENPEEVEKLLNRRGQKIKLDELVSLDKERRKLIVEIDAHREKRNVTSEKISRFKHEKKAFSSDKHMEQCIEEMDSVRKSIKDKEKALLDIDLKIKELILKLPNIPDDSVPRGESEKDNKVVRQTGDIPGFDFEVKPHWDTGERLGLLDFAAASKISGSRFVLLRGIGCKLERMLINFMVELHLKRGYTEVLAPYLVNRESATGTGQLPKFEEELFKCQEDGLYLIPTAEVSVTNIHSDEILEESQLPKKYVSYSACFRREAGSYGKDTRGLIRNHQFNKVELVKFVKPEESAEEHEKLTLDAEEVLKQLGLTYRVVELCTADLGFGAAKTYDLEVWMPGEKRWREISSCSNYKDFQARRMNTKFKRLNGEKLYCHTINGSGVAVGRVFAAILENYQNPDGSIKVPAAIRDYMGTDIIK